MIVVKKTECPNGHRIASLLFADTPNMIQMVKCPVCGEESTGLISQSESVKSDENSKDATSENGEGDVPAEC